MNIEYILFDFGGTIDTNGIHWGDLMWYFYKKHNVNISETDFKAAYIYTEQTLGNNHVIRPYDSFKHTLHDKIMLQLNWLNDHGYVDYSSQQLDSVKVKIMNSLYRYAVMTTMSNADVLDILKSSGYHLGLVSNFYGNIRTVLKEMGLTNRFETVVESEGVHIRKPNPEIYALAARNLGVQDASKVLVVGDSFKNDIIPAISLGFNTAWVRDERTIEATTMFGKKYDASELALPTITISKLSQVVEFLET